MGCDQQSARHCQRGGVFQSTHPHGVRQQILENTKLTRQVSIHAPAWGATGYNYQAILEKRGFNPRTRMGCDSTLGKCASLYVFQSTHPHGVRPTMPSVSTFDGSFVSIHAPAWGATAQKWAQTKGYEFQSTHPHGVRLCTI